jgi:hypothetical protein
MPESPNQRMEAMASMKAEADEHEPWNSGALTYV